MPRKWNALTGALAALLVAGCNLPVKPGTSGDQLVVKALKLIEADKHEEALPLLLRAQDRPLKSFTKSEVLTTIGNCYNRQDQFDEALRFHEAAIEADPQNHKAYVNQGIVYRLQGEYDKAADCYSKALELQPDYAELHASMGALAIFQDKPAVAVEHLERAVQLDDTLPVAHSNLAVAYAMVDRFDDADRELQKAVVRGYRQAKVIRERIDQIRESGRPK
jgi:tetratricopeptide (TPR) repeat protein